MALTGSDRDVAIRWIAKRVKQQKVNMSSVGELFEFMIDNQLPSPAAMSSELDAIETAQAEERITKLRAELTKLEGR